jgi:hypothetical protein
MGVAADAVEDAVEAAALSPEFVAPAFVAAVAGWEDADAPVVAEPELPEPELPEPELPEPGLEVAPFFPVEPVSQLTGATYCL